ncbi:MAG: hypothetical protein RL632_385 [Bacteroidota bacterium]|jgi:hypothetical protein
MTTLFGPAGIELLLAMIIGIMTVYFTKMVLMNFYIKKTNELNPYKNLSFMIFLSGTIFSVAYITFGIMQPLTATFKVLNTSGEVGFPYILSCLQYTGMFLLLGYVFSGIITFIAYKLFAVMTTQLNEYEEIRDNNVGVAILLVTLTIVTAMFAKEPFIVFLESLIPYPDVPSIM